MIVIFYDSLDFLIVFVSQGLMLGRWRNTSEHKVFSYITKGSGDKRLRGVVIPLRAVFCALAFATPSDQAAQSGNLTGMQGSIEQGLLGYNVKN